MREIISTLRIILLIFITQLLLYYIITITLKSSVMIFDIQLYYSNLYRIFSNPFIVYICMRNLVKNVKEARVPNRNMYMSRTFEIATEISSILYGSSYTC